MDTSKIERLKQELLVTDYVVLKLYECKIKNDDATYNELLKKYSDILTRREEIRKEINELQDELQVS